MGVIVDLQSGHWKHPAGFEGTITEENWGNSQLNKNLTTVIEWHSVPPDNREEIDKEIINAFDLAHRQEIGAPVL